MDLILELSFKIKEYRKHYVRERRRGERGIREHKANYSVEEALLQHSKVAQLQAPNKRVPGALKQMFTQGGCRILDGKAREYLDQKHELDLIALKSSSEDALSNYLRKT